MLQILNEGYWGPNGMWYGNYAMNATVPNVPALPQLALTDKLIILGVIVALVVVLR